MKNVIVIPTHISGIQFLENLLASFKGYDKYPILIVINGYKKKDLPAFLNIKKKFEKLPLSMETMKGNYFEFGAIYYAYKKTDYDNILLIQHSCEIVDTDLFNMVFEKYKDQSVGFCINMTQNWWISSMAKYRREILKKIELDKYLPSDMWGAVLTEIQFTNYYRRLDRNSIVLFDDWNISDVFEEKYGRLRMKIANKYIIKWKTHWNKEMVIKELGLLKRLKWMILDYINKKAYLPTIKKILRKIKPAYLYFLWHKYRNPEIFNAKTINIISSPSLAYSMHAVNWFLTKGETTLKLDYPLDENSLVIDVGGYMGEFSDKIKKRYKCNILIFEPHSGFHKILKKKFQDDPKVISYPFGLSDKNSAEILSNSYMGSTIYQESPGWKESKGISLNIELKDIKQVLEELKVKKIDLIKINIEGGEYPLLKRMIETGIVEKCKNIQIQFHSFYPNSSHLVKEIRKQLSNTHYCTYNYPFVWENWKKHEIEIKNIFLNFYINHKHLPIYKPNQFLKIYQQYLSKYIGTECNILEIGVYDGGSLQMWANVFGPKAKIYGVDIQDYSKNNYGYDNIEVIKGDITDPKCIQLIKDKIGHLDVIIDDGGHYSYQQIFALKNLWDIINNDGFYICEDVGCSYMAEYTEQKPTFSEYTKTIIDKILLDNSNSSMHFFYNLIILHKSPDKENSLNLKE